jgi:tetratricopeptide (TPR) repeat protein
MGFDMHEQRLRVGQAFIEDLNQLSKGRRVVFALDTAEKLLPLADPTAEPLGFAEEYPDILNWLLETFLPQIENVVVLLAGRPGPRNLKAALEEVAGKHVIPIPLEGLSIDETNSYFEAVAEAARKSEDYSTAERIETLDDEIRESVYWALCVYDEDGSELGVRPILLSLVIDHLAISGRPSPALQQLFQRLGAVPSAQMRRQIESDLVSGFMNIARPANEVIRTLALLRKGADASLLARVADLRKPDGTWDEERAQNWLEKIRPLSFVKTRPHDQRVFLHDEMYDLFQRYVLDKPDYESHKQRILQAVADYYAEHIEAARKNLARHVPDPGQAFPEVEVLTRLRVELQNALTEDLHYALQADLAEGIDRYLLYAEGALVANDESLDMQLRAELLTTFARERAYAMHELKWASDEAAETEWNEQIQTIDRLEEEVIIPDMAVRWAKRLTQQGQYQAALDVVECLRRDVSHLISPASAVAKADLAAWEGAIRAYQGNYAGAEEAVKKALQEIEEGSPLNRTWQRIVLGRVYNNQGYVSRSLGQILRATEAYKDALPYWRDLGLGIDQANTLNNLAYALALQGGFREADLQAKDALGLRKKLGPQPPVVLSLSTLAEIEILAGGYQIAEEYADHARQLAESLDFERGKGLALLALAALHRFQADPQETENVEERQDFLGDAFKVSESALEIFEELGEWEGRFRAFYERAIALREQCRLAREGGYPQWTEDQLRQKASEAEEDFQEAAEEARQHGRLDLYLDALMGRAWLRYYLEEEDLKEYLNALFDNVKNLVPEYLIEPSRWPDISDSTILGIFAQLGRYHILQGVLALDRAKQASGSEKENYLSEAGMQFTLAFEYDRHIGKDFRDLGRGITLVYDRLRKFNPRELMAIFGGVRLAWSRRIPRRGGPGHIEEAEDLLLWRTLEEHFGTYERLRDLAS